MVVWRGKGWIIIVLALLAIGIPLELEGVFCGLGQLVLFCIFGWVLWILGNKLNAGQNEYSELHGKFHWKDILEAGAHDERDSTPFGPELSPSHSCTMIKMQYWFPIFIALGIFCLIVSLF